MTGPGFLLDTNVVIGYLDGREPMRELMVRHGVVPSNAAVSQITRMELSSFPSIARDEEAKIEALLQAVPVILIDDRIERATIALRRRSRLKLPDAIIGATAIVHGLKLLTFDQKLHAALALTPLPIQP